VDATILPYIKEKLGEFRQTFLNLRDTAYIPLYRLRFVLSRMENTLLAATNSPLKGHRFIHDLQVEHILPQTPKNGIVPPTYAANLDDYKNYVYRLGNVTLVESVINQAVNNFNDLDGNWFAEKQNEYAKSNLLSTNLLDHNYSIGKNTAINQVKAKYGFSFSTWDRTAIEARQAIMLELALETWRINGKRLDQVAIVTSPATAVIAVAGN